MFLIDIILNFCKDFFIFLCIIENCEMKRTNDIELDNQPRIFVDTSILLQYAYKQSMLNVKN